MGHQLPARDLLLLLHDLVAARGDDELLSAQLKSDFLLPLGLLGRKINQRLRDLLRFSLEKRSQGTEVRLDDLLLDLPRLFEPLEGREVRTGVIDVRLNIVAAPVCA